MAIEIGKDTFQRYLWNIHKGGYSGILRVERKNLWKEISFDKGSPVAARSNILKECMGRLLIANGLIDEEKCNDSLILKKGLRARQGEALIKMGFLKENQLPDMLKLQLRLRLFDLFAWKDCTYRFMPSEVTSAVHLEEKVGKIIVEGIKERYLELEKELSPFRIKYLKRSESFDSVLGDLGFETSPVDMDGKTVDQVLSHGREAASLLYSLILTDALNLTDTSEYLERLSLFHEKIAGKNYFETLAVSQDARDTDIKKAYYNLAKLYHPDLYETIPDNNIRSLANETFCQISSAYEVLCDEKSRKEYASRLNKGYTEGDATMVSRILLSEMEFKKGQSFLRVKNFEDAEKSFQTAVDMNPEEGEFYAYLGWAIYNKNGRSQEEADKAKEYVAKAISMSHRMAMPYYFLGYMYRVEGSLEAALKEFDRALKLDPKLVEPLREIRLINIRKEKEGKQVTNKGIFSKLFK